MYTILDVYKVKVRKLVGNCKTKEESSTEIPKKPYNLGKII